MFGRTGGLGQRSEILSLLGGEDSGMPLAMERRERLIQNGTAIHAKIVANMMIAEIPKTKETTPKP